MIHEVSGDILLTKAAAIAHGVAPGDDFKQGLALALRERWPGLYNDFKHHCRQNHPKPGGAWAWSSAGQAGAVRIVNLLTQDPPARPGEHPGKARAEYVNESLRALHKWIEAEKPRSVALPRLATGVGGLAWKDVEPLIQKHLGKVPAQVFLYTTYQKGVAAAEPQA
jgi:O-acetyl-ADP-ribose deacetylase (regulator of RNase III)